MNADQNKSNRATDTDARWSDKALVNQATRNLLLSGVWIGTHAEYDKIVA